MTIDVKIIQDSVAPSGNRLTTFQLKYPRYIHGEVMTHRMFSRNASSSRAIPVKTMIERIKDDPVVPIHWGKNQKGMQAYSEISPTRAAIARCIWLCNLYVTIPFVRLLIFLGVAKQISNRILEPWSHIHVVLSATEFNNFFSLRYHHAAQPEICELAKKMWEAYSSNVPIEIKEGEWHLPYISDVEKDTGMYNIDTLLKMSTARCARVSYMKHDGYAPSVDEDIALYNRLLSAQPKHSSPAEHQAMAVNNPDFKSGNFTGWLQYRKTIENGNITTFLGPLQ